MIARLLRTLSARRLGKHGNQVRREREREHIKATAREMRERMGLPPLKALG